MTTSKKRKLFAYAGLAAILAVVVGANLIWVQLETRPPHWDMGRHLWTSLVYYDLAQHRPGALFEAYYYYPPLIYLMAIPFYAWLGVSVGAAVAANNVFLVLGAIATAGIARQLTKRWGAALLAALVFVTAPMMASQFKEFQVDGPLACLTALALWALVASPDFSRRRVAIGFGLAAGAGMLCKWTFPGIIALPLAYAVMLAAVHSWRERSWSRLFNIVLAGVIAGAMTYVWYWAHRHQLKLDVTANNAGAAALEGDPVGWSPAALTYYAVNLVNVQVYLVPALLMVVGMWRAVRRRSPQLVLVVLLVVGTYGFFTVVSNKDARYTLPFMAGVAVLAVFWLTELPRRWRMGAQWALAAYCGLTYWAVSFGLPGLPQEIKAGNHPGIVLWGQHGYIIGKPSGEDWHLAALMQAAAGHSLSYSGPDTVWFNSWSMMYYATRYGVRYNPAVGTPDFWLIRYSGSTPAQSGFTPRQTVSLPDHTQLTLYKAAK